MTAATTSRRTAAKKAATPRAASQKARSAAAARAVPEAPTAPGPLLDLDQYPQEQDPETVHLFTLDGVDYFVPAHPRAGIALTYLQKARVNLSDANAWAAEQLLGPDAWRVLVDWPGLTFELLGRIVGLCVNLVVGAAEAATSPLGRG